MVIAAAPTSPLVRSPMERRKISLTTGTRLVREWRGVTYTVLVHADGFEWNGRRYRSLTIVAREITGAQGVAGFGGRSGPNVISQAEKFAKLDLRSPNPSGVKVAAPA